ncbi:MAG: lamin tail domain-containing protein, partial [Sphingobacteriales bacterium]
VSPAYTIVNNTTIIAEVPAAVAATSAISVANGTGCFSNATGTYTLISATGTCSGAMSDLIISEVYDPASGNNHYIEIFNGTANAIDLDGPDYAIEISNDGGATSTIDINGSIPAGAVRVYYAGSNGGLATGTQSGAGSGFNENDQIRLLKNDVIIDRMITPNNTGYNWRRSNAVTGPNATYTAAEWSLREETNASLVTTDLGSFAVSSAAIDVTVHPLDQTCSFSMSITASGAPTAYQWKYYNTATNTWNNVTSAAFPLATIPASGAGSPTSTTLTITGDISDYLDYQFYCEIRKTGPACAKASNAAQFLYATRPVYRSNIASGNWTTPGHWMMSTDGINYVTTCTYPRAINSNEVIIQAGQKMLHNTNIDIDVDKLTILSGGELEVAANAKLILKNGQAAADLIVQGTLMDRATSGNGISFETAATWSLANTATIIKTNSSSATTYRDHYETGIANISAGANWIYRYDNASTTSIPFASSTATVAMYYPNLILENTVSGNTYASSFNATTPALSIFTMLSAGNAITIKGNFDVGGSGAGSINFLNINTHSPVAVNGNLIVRAGSTLRNNGNAVNNGTGFNIKGHLTVDGTFINNGGAAQTGMLRFSGNNTQNITGTGSMHLEHVDIANSGTAGNGVDVQRSFSIPGILSFMAGTPKLRLSSGLVTLSSSAERTAQVAAVPHAAAISYGTGMFEVERYLPAVKAWRFLAAPVTTASSPTIRMSWQEGLAGIPDFGTQITGPQGTAAGFDGASPAPAMKWYDMTSNTYKPVNRTDTVIANPAGYMVFVRGDRNVNTTAAVSATNLRIRGQIHTQQQTFTINRDAVQSLGNPYPSAISFDAIANHPSNSSLQRSYTAWDPYLNMPNGNSVGGYQTITDISGVYEAVPAGTLYYSDALSYPNIESGQAVYIKNASTTAVLSGVITEQMKATGSRLAGRSAATLTDRQFIRSSVYNAAGTIVDGNLLALDDELEDSIDVYDAAKFTNAAENFGLRRHGKRLAVEARGRLRENDTIFYHMLNMKEQAYRLKIVPRNLISTNLQAIFIDKFLRTAMPLNLGDTNFIPVVITAAAASKAADRFMIVFKSMAGPLPVNFVSITAQRQADRSIAVNWKVANEI